jgi:hypothetical protein
MQIDLVKPLIGALVGAIISYLGSWLRNIIVVKHPLRQVLAGIGSEREKLTIIYSSTPVRKFRKVDNSSYIDYPFLPSERNVMTFYDAIGIAHLYLMLFQAGKKLNIQEKTSSSIIDNDFNTNIICIGSPNSNIITGHILRDFHSPFFFQGSNSEIIRSREDPSFTWKASAAYDYGIIVKMTDIKANITILIMAGIGPIGTAGCCHFLTHRYQQVASRVGSHDFGIVLKLSRKIGFTKSEEIDFIEIKSTGT